MWRTLVCSMRLGMDGLSGEGIKGGAIEGEKT